MIPNSTYLLIVVIGFILTAVVGVILMRAGHGFLEDVFDSEEAANSTTKLLGVLFYLVAFGMLGLASPHALVVDPTPDNTVQLIVTQLGGVMLVLGVLHGLTLLLLSRVRSRRRNQSLEESMSGQYEQQRRQRQANRQQVIEAGGSGGGTASS